MFRVLSNLLRGNLLAFSAILVMLGFAVPLVSTAACCAIICRSFLFHFLLYLDYAPKNKMFSILRSPVAGLPSVVSGFLKYFKIPSAETVN